MKKPPKRRPPSGAHIGVLAARHYDRIPATRNAVRWVEERIRGAMRRAEKRGHRG